MLAAVDPKFAFLSALLPAPGAVIGVPSLKPLDTVPIPTASITVPESAAPSLKATLLLLVIVALVFLLQPRAALILVLHHKKKP